jgi:molybdopterin-biosynthesis enzyme MoeA-like protein
LADRDILTDDRAAIAEKLRQWSRDPSIDVVLSTGGTGLTGRDVSVEAHRDVYEKEIDAFSTVFTHVSMKKLAHRRSRAEQRAAWPMAPICLHCRAVRAPVKMLGTKYSLSSWISGINPVILSKLCHGWMSICKENNPHR